MEMQNAHWLVTITGALSLVIGWVKFRHGAVRISQARSQRLWLLLTRHRWQSQHSAVLTLACAPLFGTLHPDDIRYGLTREQPLLFLAARRWAKRTVRLNTDKTGYEDVRGENWQRISYKDAAGGFLVGAVLSVPFMALNTIWLWDENIYLNTLTLLNAFCMPALFCAFSAQFDAAHRILTPGHFAPAHDGSAAPTLPGGRPGERAKRSKAGRQATRKDTSDAAPDAPTLGA